ncbi:MAG: UbiA family prenyltransferase, partial [Algiphilus sp.]
MRTAALTDKLPAATRHRISDYYALCKPRVVMLITFTAMVGMLLASPGMVDLGVLVWGSVGITLMAAAAAAFNQILDRQVDARMA